MSDFNLLNKTYLYHQQKSSPNRPFYRLLRWCTSGSSHRAVGWWQHK